MTKFFVQSGKIRKVIFAADANAAALWLMNLVMEKFHPDQKPVDGEFDPFHLMNEGLTLLGDEVFVSEHGFECLDPPGDDSVQFETVDLFTEWNELALAVSKMEKMLLGRQDLKLCELAS